jgi:hypothetical protein
VLGDMEGERGVVVVLWKKIGEGVPFKCLNIKG